VHSLFNNRYNQDNLNEQIKILQFLLDKKLFDLNDYSIDNLSIIQLAITLGDLPLKILRLLLAYGADPNLITITETLFQSWSKEFNTLPKGIKTIDIFKSQNQILISNYGKGLIPKDLYYKQGIDFYENVIKLL